MSMNTDFYNVTHDFIMSEMTRRQNDQFALQAEYCQWMKLEQVYNCDGGVRTKGHLISPKKLTQLKQEAINKTQSARNNIANALIALAHKIEATA